MINLGFQCARIQIEKLVAGVEPASYRLQDDRYYLVSHTSGKRVVERIRTDTAAVTGRSADRYTTTTILESLQTLKVSTSPGI